MTAEATQPTAAEPAPATPAGASTSGREKTAIPKNPGRRDLGMKATLLFPNKEIVEQYYVPLIYTACRTCYSELTPDDIFDRATDGRIEAAKMQKLISGVIESGHGSTIEHSGWPATTRDDTTRDDHAGYWQAYLEDLEALLAG